MQLFAICQIVNSKLFNCKLFKPTDGTKNDRIMAQFQRQPAPLYPENLTNTALLSGFIPFIAVAAINTIISTSSFPAKNDK